jgi:hypothetical protein
MSDLALVDCFQPTLVRLERVRFFPRQLLTADDMVADQDYFRQKMRRHNRFLHGWGVVCGLEVVAAPTTESPWRVAIGSGYALGPYGDEIWVPDTVHLDLAHCGPGAGTDPCDPSRLEPRPAGVGIPIYVAVKYAECLGRPVRAAADCGCDEQPCEYSRVRDSFEIECLTELPPSPPVDLICDLLTRRRIAPCPPCPTDPWVVLARVQLPASAKTPVEDTVIDNFSVRRHLFSTARLQEQLIRCCCGRRPDAPPVPAVVTSVDPANGATVDVTSQSVPLTVTVVFSKDIDAATIDLDTVQIAGFRETTPVPTPSPRPPSRTRRPAARRCTTGPSRRGCATSSPSGGAAPSTSATSTPSRSTATTMDRPAVTSRATSASGGCRSDGERSPGPG